MDFRTFRLQAEISLFDRRPADAIDKLSIDRQLDHTIDTDHVVDIPLPFAATAVFQRLAAAAPGIVGDRFQAVGAEQLTVDVGDRLWRAIFFLVDVDPLQFQHLDFHTAWQPSPLGYAAVTPGKHAGIPPGFHVTPFDVQDEILVLLFTAHDADRFPGANQQAIADVPRVRAGIDIDPAGQVDPIEERPKAWQRVRALCWPCSTERGQNKRKQTGAD